MPRFFYLCIIHPFIIGFYNYLSILYMQNFCLFLLLVPALLSAQKNKRDSVWMPLKFFAGHWTGEGKGNAGPGKYERSYEFILAKNFIEIRNNTTYPPTETNPEGEVHKDVGYFSYDKSIRRFRLRQFHIEGFVNEFILDSISPDQKTIVFITESIENIPRGWKARETYRILNENEFEETFELSEPGKGFAIYTIAKLVRKK